MGHCLLETDDFLIRIPQQTIMRRIELLRDWGWSPETLQVLHDLLEGLDDPAPADQVADRLEIVPDLLPGITVSRWARMFQALIPETHADPRIGKKTSDAIPGSSSMIWRISERARAGLALFNDRDSAGLPKSMEKLFLFGTESAASPGE